MTLESKLSNSLPLNILVVEDHEGSRQALVMSLAEWGHRVIAVDSGDKALPALRRHPELQVVLTDWRLPGMDGLQLCQEVRALDDRFLYVIMMTARNERGDRVRSLEAGADGFIDKPLDLQELRSQISVASRLCDLESKLGAKISNLKEAHEELTQESEVRETLVDLGIVLSGQLDRDSLLESFLDSARRLNSARHVAFLADPEELILRGEPGEHTYLKTVLLGLPTIIREHGGHLQNYSADFGCLLVTPLVVAGKLLGTLVQTQETPFSDRQIRATAGLAAQAAVALDNARLYRIAVDNETRLQATNRELSERYYQLESLRAESEATQSNLDSVLSGIQEAFFLLDRGYRFLYTNQAAAALAESSVTEMIGRSFWELFPDFVGSQLDHALEQATDAGPPARLEEYYVSRGRWYEHRVHPSHHGPISVFTLDITEIKQAELAARQTELWLKAIFDQTSGYFAILHPDGRTAGVNQAALAATGLPLQAILHHPVWDIALWDVNDEKERLRRSWDQALTGSLVREIVSYRFHDGTLRTMDRSLTPIVDELGQIRYILVEGLDITNLKKTEEALERARDAALLANRMKSQFLANMSHEIRTPISGIRGMTEFLQDTELDTEQKEYVEAISRSSQSLLAIVGDVLDLSRIEAGEMEIREEVFELSSTVEHLVGLFGFRAREKGVALEVQHDDSLPPVVKGDPDRLRQVLTNLVNNAMKFTDRGSIQIVVSVGERRGPHSVRFDVCDTGIGIQPEAIEKLFLPFSQVDPSPSRRYGGTGLGLSIVKRLVELMDGEVGVSSNYGQGSNFWFELPLAPSGEAPQLSLSPSPSEHQGEGSDFGDLRVLVAEDNDVSRRVAMLQLEKLGVWSRAVTNGHEALEALREEPFDLILMDCQMPVLDGYSAASVIRSSEFDGHKDVVIVALTAHALKGERERCLAAGMDDYTIKPLPMNSLRNLLAGWSAVRKSRVPAG